MNLKKNIRDSIVKYTKAQTLIEDAHTCQCMPDTWTNMWLDIQVHILIFESYNLKFPM